MKTQLVSLLPILILISGCTEPLKLPPVKAKACYVGEDGRVCVGSDGEAINIEAEAGRVESQP